MSKIRLLYSKTGKAKFISHLDFMATMRRALLRAGIELKYSQGFNPHPYMSVALPLPVGFSGVCELIDVGIEADAAPNGLADLVNRCLPEGIEIIEAYVSERKFNCIAWVAVKGLLYYDSGTPPNTVGQLTKLFANKSIVISKKTKRGVSDIDIAPFIKEVYIDNDWDTKISMKAKVSAQDPSITPENLMGALGGSYETLIPDFYDFTRTAIFDKDMYLFR
ncbi:MAG: TIGR03936 family radical SAM-associated protein [Oscillospiraceae bacterium]|nr:TIGR03936 family radical SAM-associated protein [Oscillospiraceae bacterium]